jgi:hypothetical protein
VEARRVEVEEVPIGWDSFLVVGSGVPAGRTATSNHLFSIPAGGIYVGVSLVYFGWFVNKRSGLTGENGVRGAVERMEDGRDEGDGSEGWVFIISVLHKYALQKSTGARHRRAPSSPAGK